MPEPRWGLTLPFAGVPLRDHAPFFRLAEELGYDDLWTGDTAGRDGFTPLVLAAAYTERIRLATGVVNPYTRGRAALAQQAAALADASGGRFVLGLGASSNVIVERWNGIPFEKPLSRMRTVVAVLRPVLAGDRGAGGFKLETPPAEPVPIVLAALRGKMLRLGGELGRRRVHQLPAASRPPSTSWRRARRRGGGRTRSPAASSCRFFCVPGERGGPGAEVLFAAYATVPVYTEFFRGSAGASSSTRWSRRGRAAIASRRSSHAPVDLVRDVFIFGEPAAMRERLGEYAARGITTLVLTPLAAPDALPGLIDALAP